MSSFYQRNLKDAKKVKDVEINEAEEEENIIVDYPRISVKNVYYPYKAVIHFSHYLTFFALIIFALYSLLQVPIIIFDPHKFLDPCNETNAMTLDQVEKIKNNIDSIHEENNSINAILRYDMPLCAKEYFVQKLANLSDTSNNLQKKLEEQKEIRFICYKQNLETNCEKGIFLEMYKLVANAFHIYVTVVILLLLNSFYFISKAKKCKLLPEQVEAINLASGLSVFLIICHTFYALIMLAMSYIFPCNIENDLKKFSL